MVFCTKSVLKIEYFPFFGTKPTCAIFLHTGLLHFTFMAHRLQFSYQNFKTKSHAKYQTDKKYSFIIIR